MCTAIVYKNYCGRTLDLDVSYGERVTVTPRRFPLTFRHLPPLKTHPALIGMATVEGGVPLYFEAANECGLFAAALNFPHLAQYAPPRADRQSATPFEVIPWLLGQCESLAEARDLLSETCVCDTAFSAAMPNTPLHWFVADKTGAIAVEAVAEGLCVYDDPVRVLTNSPSFPYHMTHLADYMGVSALPPQNRFGGEAALAPYSRGMGGMGLPGDLSSASRFVRAAFLRENAHSEGAGDLAQFFHVLDGVAHPRGSVRLADGGEQITVYTSAYDADKGICYYTTYENRRITAVDMHRTDLDGDTLVTYPLRKKEDVYWER